MVRTGGAGPKGISCLVVEKGAPGLSFGKKEQKLGWNTQPTAMVIFEDCRVPAANRLGAEGDGFKIAMMGLDGGRLNIAACSLGGARACFEAARGHMLERRQFGQRARRFPGLAVQARRHGDRARCGAADGAARRGEPRRRGYRRRRCIARWPSASRPMPGSMSATRRCSCHGGYGYLKDFPIERYLRDVRVHQILEGTNEIMRVIIARHLLRQ